MDLNSVFLISLFSSIKKKLENDKENNSNNQYKIKKKRNEMMEIWDRSEASCYFIQFHCLSLQLFFVFGFAWTVISSQLLSGVLGDVLDEVVLLSTTLQ